MFNNILDKNIRIFQAVRLVILTDKVVKWRKMENEHNSDMATPQKRLSDTHKHIFPLCFFFVKERTSFTNLPISMPTTIHIFDMISSQRGGLVLLLHSYTVIEFSTNIIEELRNGLIVDTFQSNWHTFYTWMNICHSSITFY